MATQSTQAAARPRISCSCGLAYIGETKRSLETRLKEHQATTRRGETDKSAIAEHAWEKQHHPNGNHYTRPCMEPHHLAGQGSITHRIGRATLTPQPRPENSHRRRLETTPEARFLTGIDMTPTESKICTIEL